MSKQRAVGGRDDTSHMWSPTSVLHRAFLSRVDGPRDSPASGTNDRGGVMCAHGGESTGLRQANDVQVTDTECSCMLMDTDTAKEFDGVAKDSPCRNTKIVKGATRECCDRGCSKWQLTVHAVW
jgi:hypothetical protein